MHGKKNPTLLSHAERFTRRLALSHYENFLVGGLLTPRNLRQDFYNVYAYCRMADDLADEIDDAAESLRRLDQWSRCLDACYLGHPVDHPVFVALQPTIKRFGIPAEPFQQLLVAFRQDQRITRYQHFAEVHDYCRSSANPVGRLVLYMGAAHTAERVALADKICTGLQLANFCQDVRRDALLGRIYCPLDELAEFGVDPQRLGDPAPPAGACEMLRSQVARAENFLRDGLPLCNDVPKWLARNVRLFANGGLAILAAIRAARYDVWNRRPVVTRQRQLRLVVNAWLGK